MKPNSDNHRISERILILNSFCDNLLVRLHGINVNPHPIADLFSNKSNDSFFKSLTKKFPTIDYNLNAINSTILPRADEISESLSGYYQCFVDGMYLKEQMHDLLSAINYNKIEIDFSKCFYLAKYYLELVVNFLDIMLLLSKAPRVQPTILTYAIAYKLSNQKNESLFEKVSCWIATSCMSWIYIMTEYEIFLPRMDIAVCSLKEAYSIKSMSVDNLRSSQKYNILTNMAAITETNSSITINYENLSREWMEKCIIYVVTLNIKYATTEARELWKKALRGRYVISSVRDYCFSIHAFIIEILNNVKGQSKRVTEVKDLLSTATNQKVALDRKEMRFFIKFCLKSLRNVFYDEPGLLGPRLSTLVSLLRLAKDEILWYELHYNFTVSKKHAAVLTSSTVFKDPHLGEVLYYIFDLRLILKKFSFVCEIYFIKKIINYNLPFLSDKIENVVITSEYEARMIGFVIDSFVNLKQAFENDPEAETGDKTKMTQELLGAIDNLEGTKLDILRVFAYICSLYSEKHLKNLKYDSMEVYLNTIYFDCSVASNVSVFLDDISRYDIFAHFSENLKCHFKECMVSPNRFIISFPLYCSHFLLVDNIHECDVDRLVNMTVDLARSFIDEITIALSNVVSKLCDEYSFLSHKLSAHKCAKAIALNAQKKRQKKGKAPMKKNKHFVENETDYPGYESVRHDINEMSQWDRLFITLEELASSLNHPEAECITLHGIMIKTKEILTEVLVKRLSSCIQNMVMVDQERNEITRPSELVRSINAGITIFQSLENYVSIDVCRIISNVFPEQSLPAEPNSEKKSIASLYVYWYTDFFIRKVTEGNIVYSPTHMSFVSLLSEQTLPFAAEEYADITEMKCLAELIGPIGMKYLFEKIIWHVISQYNEIKKIIIKNKQSLSGIRVCYDKPKSLKDLEKQLVDQDDFIQRISIIGVLFSFYELAQSGLSMVLESRLPFFTTLVKNLNRKQVSPGSMPEIASYSTLINSAGYKMLYDPILLSSIRNLTNRSNTEEYSTACLFMVYFATSIPKLAKYSSTLFKNSVEGCRNNVHTLSKVSTHLLPVLFFVYGGSDDVLSRMKEFLALLSSSMLRFHADGNDKDTNNVLRDSVYLNIETIVNENPFLPDDLLDSCLPKILIKKAYHNIITNS